MKAASRRVAGVLIAVALLAVESRVSAQPPVLWVEEGLGSSFDYQQSPMETGSLPAESITVLWVEEGLGNSFGYQHNRGD